MRDTTTISPPFNPVESTSKMTKVDLVCEIRRQNPCLTMAKIGEAVKLTRERVRQILNKHHLPTRVVKHLYICNYCGSTFKGAEYHRLFCNKSCYNNYHYAELECETCGKTFRRRYSQLRGHNYLHHFDTRHCLGVWIGKTYGFGKRKGE